jgi:hypothetical protein
MHQARHVAGLIVFSSVIGAPKAQLHSRMSTKRPAIAAAAAIAGETKWVRPL